MNVTITSFEERVLRKALIPLILATVLVILSALSSLILVASGDPDPDPSPKGMIFSSDADGDQKDDFLPQEDVCVYGVGLVKNARYKITIIDDTTMKDGDQIPPPVSGTDTTEIETDGNGSFELTVIWPHPLTPGYYDIIADCLDVGTEEVFDREWDAEDTVEASDKYGFFVIPEIPMGTIAVLFAGFTAAIIKHRKIL